MLGSAALFLAYLLAMPVIAFIAVRLLHGAAQGAYWPAANGLVAEVSAPDRRGRAFGYLQATNMAGMLIGPAIGGFIALLHIGVVFSIAAALSALAGGGPPPPPKVRAPPAAGDPAPKSTPLHTQHLPYSDC